MVKKETLIRKLELIERHFAEMRKELQDEPDPLAPWKTLQPGDKVLEIEYKTVWGITKPLTKDNKCYPGYEASIIHQGKNVYKVGTEGIIQYSDFDESCFQLLPSGPFDVSKCYPGMWVWMESQDSEPNGWIQIDVIEPVKIIADGYAFNKDGYLYYNPECARIIFSPPSPEKIITADENIPPLAPAVVPMEELKPGKYRMTIPVWLDECRFKGGEWPDCKGCPGLALTFNESGCIKDQLYDGAVFNQQENLVGSDS